MQNKKEYSRCAKQHNISVAIAEVAVLRASNNQNIIEMEMIVFMLVAQGERGQRDWLYERGEDLHTKMNQQNKQNNILHSQK